METIDQKFSIYKQILLLFISLILIALYYNSAFKRPEYNDLCLVYAIFILLWNVTIAFRYVYLHYYPNQVNENPIFRVPYGLKCYFGEPRCETGDFTVFTVIHLISYTIIGYLVPGLYLEILVISIACEFLELGINFQSKFILDPIVNMTGYVIGTQIRYRVKS